MVAVSVGPPEILIIVLVVAFLFGAKKIPELARSMGRAQSEFKKGMKEGQRNEAASEEGAPAEGETKAENAAE